MYFNESIMSRFFYQVQKWWTGNSIYFILLASPLLIVALVVGFIGSLLGDIIYAWLNILDED